MGLIGLSSDTLDHTDLAVLHDALADRLRHPDLAAYCRHAPDNYRHVHDP